MKPNAKKVLPWLGILLVSLVASVPSRAQTASATLSGTITGPSGTGVPNATISVKNVKTLRTIETRANLVGVYTVPNLKPGEYEVSASADGFGAKMAKVTLAVGARQTLDFALTVGLSLQDLGFPASQTQGNAKEQALLNKRSHMLQLHQRLGLITTIPLVATVVTGAFAGGKSTSSTSRDWHAALGSATAGLYFASAYYAIFAPKIPGTKVQGPIRLHKALAWIHGPGMILTPILGEMAFAQRSRGEKVHGIAQYHGEVAIVTAVAYGLAILSVSLKPGAVSRSKHAFLSTFGLDRSTSAKASAAPIPSDSARGPGKSAVAQKGSQEVVFHND